MSNRTACRPTVAGVRPDTSGPCAIRPDTSGPGAIRPGAIEPGAIRPGAIEPGAIGHGGSRRGGYRGRVGVRHVLKYFASG